MIWKMGCVVTFKELGEKLIFSRPVKNAPACAKASAGRQARVESAKSRLRGRPRAFHLPVRQAILRVASR